MEVVKDTSNNSLRTRLGMEEGLRNLLIRISKAWSLFLSCNFYLWENFLSNGRGIKNHDLANPDASFAWADCKAGK